jgi:hypothetical protein
MFTSVWRGIIFFSFEMAKKAVKVLLYTIKKFGLYSRRGKG